MTLLQNAIKEVAEELGIKKNKPIVANHEDLLEILKKQKEEDSFVCEMIGYRELSYGQLRFFVADVASNLHFCKLLSSFVLFDITLFFIFSLVRRTKFGEYTYAWTPFDQMKAKMEPLQYAGLQEYLKSNPVLEENGSSSTSSPLSRNWGQMSDAIPIPPPRRNDLSLPRGPSKVFLGSLPVNTTEEDISHFFSGLMIKTNGIELHTDGGRFKGSAFVFFETHDEVQKGLLKFLSHCIAFSHSPVGLALQKNGSYFKGKKVQVSIAKLK